MHETTEARVFAPSIGKNYSYRTPEVHEESIHRLDVSTFFCTRLIWRQSAKWVSHAVADHGNHGRIGDDRSRLRAIRWPFDELIKG